MTFTFIPVLLVALIGALFVFGTLLLSFILRPDMPEQNKAEIYDCGEHAVGGAWVNTNIRFYIMALIFLIFEVEVAFMYPIAVVYKKWMHEVDGLNSTTALVGILIFAGTLFIGVIYSWAKGDFEWVKKVGPTKASGPEANIVPINLRKGYRAK